MSSSTFTEDKSEVTLVVLWAIALAALMAWLHVSNVTNDTPVAQEATATFNAKPETINEYALLCANPSAMAGNWARKRHAPVGNVRQEERWMLASRALEMKRPTRGRATHAPNYGTTTNEWSRIPNGGVPLVPNWLNARA